VEGRPGVDVRWRFRQLFNGRHGRGQLLQTIDKQEKRVRDSWFRTRTRR